MKGNPKVLATQTILNTVKRRSLKELRCVLNNNILWRSKNFAHDRGRLSQQLSRRRAARDDLCWRQTQNMVTFIGHGGLTTFFLFLLAERRTRFNHLLRRNQGKFFSSTSIGKTVTGSCRWSSIFSLGALQHVFKLN